MLDHATSEIPIGSKLGIDATKKLPGEGFKRPWPPIIKADQAVKAKVGKTLQPVPADIRISRLSPNGLVMSEAAFPHEICPGPREQ